MKRTQLLSALWVFAVLNYLYCDVVSLMDSHLLGQFLAGQVEGMEINQGFLLAASVLMEISISMVLLSLLLPHRFNRWANIAAGTIMTLVQAGTLIGSPTPYYVFFSAIEIATTMSVIWLAWSWKNADQMLVLST